MKKYTLKMFMEDYKGFDFESETIILFDYDSCSQYLLDTPLAKGTYLGKTLYEMNVYDWKHNDKVITIILRKQAAG